MQTFWIYTSRPYARTPSTAVRIHPVNIQAPIPPHVIPHNIPKLIPFNNSVTHSTYSPLSDSFNLAIDTAYNIPNSATQHRNKYYKCTYPVCATRLLFFRNFCFWKKTACLWRLANLFSDPQLIPDVNLLLHKIMTSRQWGATHLLLTYNKY